MTDTLAVAEKLSEAGFSETQAAALSRAVEAGATAKAELVEARMNKDLAARMMPLQEAICTKRVNQTPPKWLPTSGIWAARRKDSVAAWQRQPDGRDAPAGRQPHPATDRGHRGQDLCFT